MTLQKLTPPQHKHRHKHRHKSGTWPLKLSRPNLPWQILQEYTHRSIRVPPESNKLAQAPCKGFARCKPPPKPSSAQQVWHPTQLKQTNVAMLDNVIPFNNSLVPVPQQAPCPCGQAVQARLLAQQLCSCIARSGWPPLEKPTDPLHDQAWRHHTCRAVP